MATVSDLVLLLEIVGGTCAALALPLLVAETVEHRAGLATGWRAIRALAATARLRWYVARANVARDLRHRVLDHGRHRRPRFTRRAVTT